MICPLQKAAEEAPDLPALITETRTLSFHDLHQESIRLALQLQRAHIQPGDRIAVLHKNCHDLIALFFAAWRLQASICPLSLRLPPAQIEACLKRIAPKLFISSFPFNTTPSPSSPSLPQSLFLFTSGSTGTPKIAILTLENLLTNAQFSIPLTSQDRYLLSLPLFHVGGIGILLRCILAKAAIVLDPNHPDITHISYVPTQLYRQSPVYKNLKCILLGGAPILRAGSFVTFDGHQSDPPLNDQSSAILQQYRPPHDRLNLGHSETVKNCGSTRAQYIHTYNKRLPIYTTYGLTEMGSMVTLCDQLLPHRELQIAQSAANAFQGRRTGHTNQ